MAGAGLGWVFLGGWTGRGALKPSPPEALPSPAISNDDCWEAESGSFESPPPVALAIASKSKLARSDISRLPMIFGSRFLA